MTRFKYLLLACLLLACKPVWADTMIGNMTGGGGLAAITDGNTATSGYREASNGYAGLTLTTPTAIQSAEACPQTNGFDASGSTTYITLYLKGKNGTAPVSGTDGVTLGSQSFYDVNSVTCRTLYSNNTATAWDHLWVYGTTGVWTAFTEVSFLEASAPPPPPANQNSQTAGNTTFFESHVPLASSLSLTTGGCYALGNCNLLPKQLVKINLGPLNEGDVIEYDAESEFTNDNSYVVSVVSNISLSTDANFGNSSNALFQQTYDREATSQSYIIGKNNGPNIDRSIVHHSPHLRSGFIMVSPEMAAAFDGEDVHLVFWAWTVASNASGGNTVSVGNASYTKLSALKTVTP